jgi:NDP-sugar pyrophosphorylase family protein
MKYQIIIPMSGFGERFRQAGYTVPKPLIEVLGKPIIAHVLDMFPGEKDVYFICNQDHLNDPSFAMEAILRRYCPDGKVIGIEAHKKGPVYAVSRAFQQFSADAPTIVNYCDFTCLWDWEQFKRYARRTACDGAVMCYTGFHPHMLGSTNYAYIRNEKDTVLAIQEKRPFTADPMAEYASSGTYYFAHGALMQKTFEETLLRGDLLLKGEYYVSLSYVPLLEKGMDIRVFEIKRFMQWGTPEDLQDFLYSARIHRHLPQAKPPAKKKIFAGTTLIPIAGLGTRFSQAGYALPKALIPVDGRPMFLRAREDLPASAHTVVVLRSDMPDFGHIKSALLKADPDCALKVLPGPTEGQAVTCLEAMDLIDADTMLTIGACDNGYIWDHAKFDALLADSSIDFIIWAQRNYPAGGRHPEMYGWVDVDTDGTLKAVSVKMPLENPGKDPVVTGAFTFRRADDFIRAAKRMIARNGRVNNEFYVDECCNDALALGLKGVIFEVDSSICWGTPDELKTYEYWQDVFSKWLI